MLLNGMSKKEKNKEERQKNNQDMSDRNIPLFSLLLYCGAVILFVNLSSEGGYSFVLALLLSLLLSGIAFAYQKMNQKFQNTAKIQKKDDQDVNCVQEDQIEKRTKIKISQEEDDDN